MEQLQDKENFPVSATVKLSFRKNTWSAIELKTQAIWKIFIIILSPAKSV
jgi:hypothetical protein